MSTVRPLCSASRSVSSRRLVLLGTGLVGSAFVARHQALQSSGLSLPDFAWLANSRAQEACAGAPARALHVANAASRKPSATSEAWREAEQLQRGDVVVDATSSDAVASRHAELLGRGVHVVTANKLGAGAGSERARAISEAAATTGAHYGDSATVGAGLPLLHSVRALVAGGDRIHRVEGVLSGSLAWLFNAFDDRTEFSALVRQARRAGFTEPDVRLDLSGEDVRRKLVILARAAGLPLEWSEVRVESLVPCTLAGIPPEEFDSRLHELDSHFKVQLSRAEQQGRRLRFIGAVDAQGATAGLVSIAAGHPLYPGSGTDNCVAVYSDRYAGQPLLIQGPGAGAEVTAAALMDDVLAIARRAH